MNVRLGLASFSVVVIGAAFLACSSEPPSSSFDPVPEAGADRAVVDGAVIPTFDEAGISTPPDGSPELACYNAASKDACRSCCHGLYTKGRSFYVNSINECVCQPSKCGAKCANSLCKVPATNPPAGDPCIKCFNDAMNATGQNPPADGGAPDGGGLYPERGIENCAAWGDDKCRGDSDCQQTETCKLSLSLHRQAVRPRQ